MITPIEDTYITYTLLTLFVSAGLLQIGRILFRGSGRKTKIALIAAALTALTLATGYSQGAVDEGTDGTSRWTSIVWPWNWSSIFSFGWRYNPQYGNSSNSTRGSNVISSDGNGSLGFSSSDIIVEGTSGCAPGVQNCRTK